MRFVGESSAGAYSDMLGKRLPIGWTFWLSNEVYFNHQGQVYEGRGQPPDIEAPLAREDLEAGRDVALETAMALED